MKTKRRTNKNALILRSSGNSPDYSSSLIPPNSNSLRVTPALKLHSRRLNSESIEMVKNQYKLDLNLDHNILRAMAFADQEQEALKDNSSLSHGFKRMSAGMKILRTGHKASELFETVKEHISIVKGERGKGKLRDTISSQNKWMDNERNKWIKTRGKEMLFNTSSGGFVQFLKQLYEALDEDESGQLTADEIIFPLLAYGLCPDPYYIEAALKVIYNKQDSSEIILEKVDFISMFKEDSRTDKILKYLDIHTKNYMKYKKEENSVRCESAPLKIENFEHDLKQEFDYCSVDEYIKLIKKWWSELQPVNESVHISKVADFLADRHLFPNKHEGIRAIKETTNSSSISYLGYEKVFLKAIFKASLLNLAAGLNNGELDSRDASLRLKMSGYQRNLMVNGTNPEYEFSLGRTTLQAIKKFQVTQPMSSRNKIVTEIKKTVALADEKFKERIKAYLYKIKTRARDFVNDKGEVIGNIQSIWAIRDAVKEKYAKAAPTLLEEEQSFDQFKYMAELVKVRKPKAEKQPAPRKIKMFRENFILEKYQKIVTSPKGFA